MAVKEVRREDQSRIIEFTCDACGKFIATSGVSLHWLPTGWVQTRIGAGREGTKVRLYCSGGCFTVTAITQMLEAL